MPGRWLNRREKQNPYELLRKFGLGNGMYFADLGCGSGFFALPAAEIVGESGRVFGVDIDPGRIRELSEKARSRNISNLVTRVGMGEDTIFCRGCLDMAFLGIVLHDFQDPTSVLANARTMLKPGGKLVNLDWRRIHQDFGPPYEIRFSEERASSVIEGAGFEVERVELEGKYHYVITARPIEEV